MVSQSRRNVRGAEIENGIKKQHKATQSNTSKKAFEDYLNAWLGLHLEEFTKTKYRKIIRDYERAGKRLEQHGIKIYGFALNHRSNTMSVLTSMDLLSIAGIAKSSGNDYTNIKAYPNSPRQEAKDNEAKLVFPLQYASQASELIREYVNRQ